MRRIEVINGDCIEIHNCYMQDGYPRFSLKGVLDFGHRHAYRKVFGDIPKGMVIMHTCDNRRCININHLRIGTISENIKDRCNKKRTAVGEKNGRSKLNRDIVNFIRTSSHLYTSWEFSKMFNVDPKAIRNIINGVTWK